jgi:hypothetical protein
MERLKNEKEFAEQMAELYSNLFACSCNFENRPYPIPVYYSKVNKESKKS